MKKLKQSIYLLESNLVAAVDRINATLSEHAWAKTIWFTLWILISLVAIDEAIEDAARCMSYGTNCR